MNDRCYQFLESYFRHQDLRVIPFSSCRLFFQATSAKKILMPVSKSTQHSITVRIGARQLRSNDELRPDLV
jgi:hypothetical protein